MAEERIRIEQFEYEGFGHCGGFATDGQDYFCEFGGESIPINKEFCEKSNNIANLNYGVIYENTDKRAEKNVSQNGLEILWTVCYSRFGKDKKQP